MVISVLKIFALVITVWLSATSTVKLTDLCNVKIVSPFTIWKESVALKTSAVVLTDRLPMIAAQTAQLNALLVATITTWKVTAAH